MHEVKNHFTYVLLHFGQIFSAKKTNVLWKIYGLCWNDIVATETHRFC